VIVRPSADVLAGLTSERWGRLVPRLREAIAAVPVGEASAPAERLRSEPASAFGSGRARRELGRVIAEDDRVWTELVRLLDPLPEDLAWFGGLAPEPAPGGDGVPDEAVAGPLRERVRELQQDRAELRRRLDGAEVRAETAARRADEAEAARALAERTLAEHEAALADAEAERQRALERGARRAGNELERLRGELTAARRARSDAEAERDAAIARAERAESELAALRARQPLGRTGTEPARAFRPGRPSRLPPGVEDETTEAAELLLHAGRLVLVDGYNLTLRNRAELDLAGQRAWIATTLAAFVARIPVRPLIVFDGQRAGGSRTMPPTRGVDVAFTPAGVSADDEIVFRVEATDEPVVVVTDDQELRRRVRALGADVVPTVNLLGVVGG
jgi:predicted RNA-binding protein with PIN domain